MVSRRTLARVDFVLELLLVSHRVRKLRTRSGAESHGIAPGWFLVGAVTQVAYTWGHDHDIGAMGTNRLRRALVVAIWVVVTSRLFPRPADYWDSYALGGSLGQLCYRLWYGVLRPVPGDGDA